MYSLQTSTTYGPAVANLYSGVSRHTVTLRRCSVNVAEVWQGGNTVKNLKNKTGFETQLHHFFFANLACIVPKPLFHFLLRASPKCCWTEWWVPLMLNQAPQWLNNKKSVNAYTYFAGQNQNHAEHQAHKVQASARTAGRATYQRTSLVVTIPCAWWVFGPFCHFAL